MMKQLLLFSFFGFIGLSFINVPGIEQAILLQTDSLGTDTVKTGLNDPKKEFRNLFDTETLETGVSIDHLNPKAVSFVNDYMAKHTGNLNKMKDWAKPYFNLMDDILLQHGLPVQLKYLAVIESNLKSNATSWMGAVGPWQFMPATAKRLGLRITKKVDERKDYYKSTHAASKYLTELFNIYGDWLLVIAAYNGGPGNVNSAIRRSGSRDFWTLQHHLPTESKNHVKKFIATHYIMEGEGGVTTLTKAETKDFIFSSVISNTTTPSLTAEEEAGVKTLTITGKYNSMVIAKHINLDIIEFNRLNPGFDTRIATGSYELKLAPGKMDLFLANKYVILNESLQVLLNSANEAARKSR